MSSNWERLELIRVVEGKRRGLAMLDQRIIRLEQDLAIARGREEDFEARVAPLKRRVAALAVRRFWVDGQYAGCASSPTPTGRPMTVAEVNDMDALTDQIASLQTAYERDLDDRAIRTVDAAGVPVTIGFSPTSCEQRLQHARRIRAVEGARLAELEAKLSPGEQVLAGAERADVRDHAERVQRLREQAGVA
jgi:hypothetical protein